MSGDKIKEALAVLDSHTYGAMVHMGPEASQIVRDALTAAAKEAAAWEEIEAWMSVPASDEPARELNLIRWAASWEIELMPSPWDDQQTRTRQQAISQMADLIRHDRTK